MLIRDIYEVIPGKTDVRTLIQTQDLGLFEILEKLRHKISCKSVADVSN